MSTTTDWFDPTFADVEARGGSTWITPTKVYDSNNQDAKCDIPKLGDTYWLRATNFLFDGVGGVPSGATIEGIEVDIERAAETATRIRDGDVFLCKSSGRVGDDKASVTYWPITDTYESYGGVADTWSAGLTAADVRASTFGVHIFVFNLDEADALNAYIDHIRIRITYSTAVDITVFPPVSQADGSSVVPAMSIGSSLLPPVSLSDSECLVSAIGAGVGIASVLATSDGSASVPVLSIGSALLPPAAMSDGQGLVPSVVIAIVVEAVLAEADGASLAPILSIGLTLLPPEAISDGSGLIPSILIDAVISATLATIDAAGVVPTLSIGLSLLPPESVVDMEGLIPVISTTGDATIEAVLATSDGSGLIPSLSVGLSLSSPEATADADGLVPILSVGLLLTIPIALADAEGLVPEITIGVIVLVPVVTADGVGLAPVIELYKPIAAYLVAILVEDTTARIRGEITDDKGYDCETRFRWREVLGEWTETDWDDNSGTYYSTNDQYYHDLSGLDPATEYEFQTRARGVVV